MTEPDTNPTWHQVSALFQASQDAVCVCSVDGVVRVANAKLGELLRRPDPDSLVGTPLLSVVAEESAETVAALLRCFAARESIDSPQRAAFQSADGHTHDVVIQATTATASDVHALVLILRPALTPRPVVGDRELEVYRAIFERNTAVKLLLCPASGRIVDANRAAEEFYGWPLDTLRTMTVMDLNLLSAEEIAHELENTRIGKRTYFRFRHRTTSGIKHVEIHTGPIEFDGETLLLSIIHDVTERNRLEEELRRAQRFESIGRLAGGLAHDFNNLLTVMLASAGFLARRLAPDSPLRRHVGELDHAVRRASELTSALLAVGRRQLMQPTVFDLNELVDRQIRLLQRTLPASVRLSLDLGRDVPAVHADPSQIEQVLMNLTLNARDAVGDQGTIIVRTRASTDETPAWAVLEVADTGAGMDESTRVRVFEPFFTTKPVGTGTGLGLASVYGIVTQSGGQIQVESDVGRGSRFVVRLPPVPHGAVRRSRSSKPPPPTTTGGTVLLVEDEPGVRAVLGEALRGAGHEVLEATSAEQALAYTASHEVAIDILVSAVVMPGMSGVELANQMRERRPSLPVLLMSGYSPEPLRRSLPADVRLLPKPFVADTLLLEVAKLLDR